MSAGWIIPSSAVQAVGRFKPDGPTGYRVVEPYATDAPLRATRAEARADIESPSLFDLMDMEATA